MNFGTPGPQEGTFTKAALSQNRPFVFPCFLILKLCRGSGQNVVVDFTVNFASERACLVPVEHPKQARELAQTNCNV